MRGIFLLLICLLPLSACEKPQVQPQQLIKVGQRSIDTQQFARELRSRYPALASLPPSERLLQKKQLVNRLIERELILGEAQRLDVQLTPDELDAAGQELRGAYSQEEFEQILTEAGQTRATWLASLQLRLLTEKVSTAAIGPQTPISDQQIADYYKEHRDEFRRPAELRARQMLLPDLQTADEMLKQMHEGAKFADLAREHSLSPDREFGGNLGYFSQGELPPEFDRALFSLPLRQVSDPIKSPYGIHLFLVERRRKAGLRPLAQVSEEIKATLEQQRDEAAFHSWLDQLHRQTSVEVNWALLDAADKTD